MIAFLIAPGASASGANHCAIVIKINLYVVMKNQKQNKNKQTNKQKNKTNKQTKNKQTNKQNKNKAKQN